MSDTANRVLWTFIGLVLLAAGVALGLAHFGLFPDFPARTALLSDEVLTLWHRADDWNTPVVIAAGALLLVVGLWLFARQFRRRSAHGLSNLLSRGETDVRWRTEVKAGALIKALERDLVDRRIVAAHVVMTGRPPRPDAWVRLDLAPGIALSDVHKKVEQAVERFATTTGLRPGTLEVTVRPSRQAPARVR